MPTSFTYNCPHCGTPIKQAVGESPYCVRCGHRVDVAQDACDCRRCGETKWLFDIREREQESTNGIGK